LIEKKGKKEGGKVVNGLAGVVDDGVIANYSHAAGRWHGAAEPQAFSGLSVVSSWMLCRTRHSIHYAESRTMPDGCTFAAPVGRSTKIGAA
jgi:hypothetical protein